MFFNLFVAFHGFVLYLGMIETKKEKEERGESEGNKKGGGEREKTRKERDVAPAT